MTQKWRVRLGSCFQVITYKKLIFTRTSSFLLHWTILFVAKSTKRETMVNTHWNLVQFLNYPFTVTSTQNIFISRNSETNASEFVGIHCRIYFRVQRSSQCPICTENVKFVENIEMKSYALIYYIISMLLKSNVIHLRKDANHVIVHNAWSVSQLVDRNLQYLYQRVQFALNVNEREAMILQLRQFNSRVDINTITFHRVQSLGLIILRQFRYKH